MKHKRLKLDKSFYCYSGKNNEEANNFINANAIIVNNITLMLSMP